MISKKLISILSGTAAIWALSSVPNLHAAEIFVDATNDTGIEDGSAAYPFSSIPEGISVAVAGDTVTVAPGIYVGTVLLKDDVRLVSAQGPGKTVIDGNEEDYAAVSVWRLEDAPDIYPDSYIEGFTIRNGTQTLVSMGNPWGVFVRSTFEMHNCVLQGSGKSEGWARGMAMTGRVAATVTRTTISNVPIAMDAIWTWYGYPKLDNLTIDNVRTAFLPYQISVTINNNTVSNADIIMELWGNYGSGSLYGANNNFFNYAQLGTPNDSGWEPWFGITGTLEADPMFSDPAAGDYSLQAGSPLIDAGVVVGLPYAGDAPDIGAHEYGLTPVLASFSALKQSFQDAPVTSYKNAAIQRNHALANKFLALLRAIGNNYATATDCERIQILSDARDKLLNDIWSKADGFYGGHPGNDWIITQEEQAFIYEKVQDTLASIDEDLATLTCN